ncbi:MAG: tetratricopeptide repeat protein [Thermodesulfobacteriota bacterium]
MNEKTNGSGSPHEASADRVVSMDKVLFAVVITLLIGFSIGAGVTMLGTSGGSNSPTSSRYTHGQRTAAMDQKIRVSESALKRDPGNLAALVDLGNSYFEVGLCQEAIDAYTRALAIDPKNAHIRNDMGIMYRELGQYDKAVEAFRQAAHDGPVLARSRFNLGMVLAFDMKDERCAIEAWEEFLALEPCMNRSDRRIKIVKGELEKMKKRVSGQSNR